MGGCASKSKVLKGDDIIDAPAPPPQKEEDVVVKEAVVEEVRKDEGVADDDKSNKNRSLGNLFKESEEGKGLADKESVKASDVPESTSKEVEKTIPEDASAKVGTEKAPEVSPVPLRETFEEKKTEEAKSAVVAEHAGKPVEKSEAKVVTTEEKKPEEIEPTVKKPEENFETPKEKKLEEVKTTVKEPEETFETPQGKEPEEFKPTAEKKPEEVKPTAEKKPEEVKPTIAKPEEKIETPAEKKPEVKPAAEAHIPDKSQQKK